MHNLHLRSLFPVFRVSNKDISKRIFHPPQHPTPTITIISPAPNHLQQTHIRTMFFQTKSQIAHVLRKDLFNEIF